jgi:hypothetical protein
MDRLFISAPQGPPRLPGPPTFGSCPNHDATRRCCKHVHFQGAHVVSIINAGSEMTPEERRELWYSAEDLDGYKTEVRTISRKLRGPNETQSGYGNSEALPAETGKESSTHAMHDASSMTHDGKERENDEAKKPASAVDESDVAHEGETRGLEQRVCLNRQRHKYLAIRCTLKAQMESRCPEFIARISNKCTQWAKELAVAEADRDFCEAYCPQRLTTPKKLKNDCPIMNFFRRPPKRCHEGEHCSASTPDTDPCAASALLERPQQTVAVAPPLESSPEGTEMPAAAVAPPSESSPKDKKGSTCWMERCVRQKCSKDC